MVILFMNNDNDSFCNMIERVQYNVALTITGAIKQPPQLKIYKELGFESLNGSGNGSHVCAS